jgi:lysophospholipase L1-like esterase
LLLLLFTLLAAMPLKAQDQNSQRTRPTIRFNGGVHYAQRIALFKREGGIDSTAIVMLGNSLTENGKDWAERIGTRRKVVNRGIIGDNTIGMTDRLYQITPFHPRAIFLMAGINDMAGNMTYEEVAYRVIDLIETIRSQTPQTKLFVQSILPIDETEGRWKTLAGRTNDIPFANMLIKAYCETHAIPYVDIFCQMTRAHSNQLRAELSGDGLHLTEEGYRIWAAILKSYINKL